MSFAHYRSSLLYTLLLSCHFRSRQLPRQHPLPPVRPRDRTGRCGYEHDTRGPCDHIKPISLAATKEEIRALHHYTNYQPLLWRDNLVKGTRWGAADEAAWAARIYLHPEFEEVYLPDGI